MGRQRFTPEFKDEAARQMTERGDPVTKVAARLGVSSHSSYTWVRDVGEYPDARTGFSRGRRVI